MNPYNFTKMEWWRNGNKNGLGHAYVGFCDNGDKFLTFDVRIEEDGLVPVFSSFCKIGSKYREPEAYERYRSVFEDLEEYEIQVVTQCSYRDLHQIKKLYKM